LDTSFSEADSYDSDKHSDTDLDINTTLLLQVGNQVRIWSRTLDTSKF